MFIEIKPLDTLFFRTGRPFTMGDDTWADFVFPPFPSTLYGAIRSFLIFQRGTLEDFKNGKFKKELGTPNEKGSLKIKGPLLFKDRVIYFPTPLDLVYEKEDKKCKELKPLSFSNRPSVFISNYPLEKVLLWKSEEQVDEPKGWLSIADFHDYLKNKNEEYLINDNNELFDLEPKIGIARDKTKTTKEGYLYRIPMIRLRKDASLLIEMEGVEEFPDEGIFQLGGEGRAVKFRRMGDDVLVYLKNMNFSFSNDLFKLYLATPAIFENGWYPKWIDKDFTGEYNGIKLKLVACAIGRAISIGGWDLAKNEPKSMVKAVPAGSVYYFEIIEGDRTKIKEAFHLQNISEINPEEGFGLSILGEVRV